MTLQPIEIPDSIKQLPHSEGAANLIDVAYDRIEAFMLADESVIEDFVTCDFHLLDQALDWIIRNNLMTGNRFCELGCGFGVATMLAALHGMESVGIEIESVLVDQSRVLADELNIAAKFFRGNFVPRDAMTTVASDFDLGNVPADDRDVYQEIGLAMNDFDIFFAYPWPHQQRMFEAMFAACAADGALLLTYRGRFGMHLIRKPNGIS